jgi:hypothetical protein
MRLLLVLFFTLGAVAQSPAQSTDEKDAIAAVQKLFDAMAAHDATALRATLLPEARLYSVRDQRPPAATAGEDFVTQIAALKIPILERFTAPPAVSIRTRMAQVWGEYEFLRDGKFTHCGVDTVTLFKTPEGWKIAALSYTAETTGCKGH